MPSSQCRFFETGTAIHAHRRLRGLPYVSLQGRPGPNVLIVVVLRALSLSVGALLHKYTQVSLGLHLDSNARDCRLWF
jgi:hypothetical protein